MKCLAIETASRVCSVALDIDGEMLIRTGEGSRMHAEVLLPWIAELLAESGIRYRDLDALAVDRGPGGFTSLRIGLGVAQGIALAHDLPCYPVSSLAALAWQARSATEGHRVLAALDARMDEIYACMFAFDADGWPRPESPEQLISPDRLAAAGMHPFIAVGDALLRYRDRIMPRLGPRCVKVLDERMPSAEAVARLTSTVAAQSAHALAPVYLRDQVTR